MATDFLGMRIGGQTGAAGGLAEDPRRDQAGRGEGLRTLPSSPPATHLPAVTLARTLLGGTPDAQRADADHPREDPNEKGKSPRL
mmetsp:Transcript_7978/g.12407  ORF Transcript_7978/g.12407 Transcript_7978/m.12407 type:complete len:85 (+) Transcript_7978:147-401(+)